MKSKLLFETLLKSFKTSHSLVCIDLSNQSLADADVLLLVEALKDNTNIQAIDLSGNSQLTEKSLILFIKTLSILNALSTLKLCGLQLTENTLTALSTTLQTCQTLQVLDLSDNALTEMGLKSLGQGLSHHNALRALYLKNCALNTVPEVLTSFLLACPNSLEILVLAQNKLNSHVASRLTFILERFMDLKTLDVSYNQELGSRGAEAIAQAVRGLSRLTILKLDEVALEGGLERFFASLKERINLRHLSLAGNKLGKVDSFYLQKYLPNYPSLMHLDLGDNLLIEDDGSLIFAEALSHMPALQDLRLNDTGCTIHLASLMPHLKSIHSLVALDFSHQKLGYPLEPNELGVLLQALPHCPHLRLLNLSDNRLGEEAGIALGQALCNQAGLESLNLSGNALGNKGVKAFLSNIKRHPTLQRLSLARTQLTQLPEVDCFLTLKSLDLSNNALVQKNVISLCNILKATKILQQLNISHNAFDREGLKIFIQEGLALNNTLLSLDLSYTELTEEFANLLKDVFVKHPTLQRLILKGNSLSPPLVDELEALNAEKQRPYQMLYQAIAHGVINPALLTIVSSQHLQLEDAFRSGTLLHHAARCGEKEIFRTMIKLYQQHHLPLNERDKEGQTARDIALERGSLDLIEILDKSLSEMLVTHLAVLDIHYPQTGTNIVSTIQTSTPLVSSLLYLRNKMENEAKEIKNVEIKDYLPSINYSKEPKVFPEDIKDAYYFIDTAHYDVQAKQWFQKAKEGNPIAQFNIGCCYYEGSHGVPQDYKAAVFWYEKAANQGDMEAQNSLGNCYKKGNRGVPQDSQKAMEWFMLAANRGYASAQFNLGACYQAIAAASQEPQQTSEYQKAVYWYKEATHQNHKDAPYYLGLCYEKGWGVVPNRETALEYYIKAKNRGCELAQARIDKLTTSTESKILTMKKH